MKKTKLNLNDTIASNQIIPMYADITANSLDRIASCISGLVLTKKTYTVQEVIDLTKDFPDHDTFEKYFKKE